MRVANFIFVLTGAVALSGCATVIDGQTQDVTIVTPGASESRCTADNGLKYPFRGGETVDIQRSRKPLVIECYGSGNRYIRKVVESEHNKTAIANVTNAVVPGTTYDSFSGGLYEYPSVITVDFVGTPTRGFEMPDYHNKDLPSPYEQAIEDMGPGVARVEGDRGHSPTVVKKYDTRMSNNPFTGMGGNNNGAVTEGASVNSGATSVSPISPMPAPAVTPKGSTAEELTRSMNPTVFNK